MRIGKIISEVKFYKELLPYHNNMCHVLFLLYANAGYKLKRIVGPDNLFIFIIECV